MVTAVGSDDRNPSASDRRAVGGADEVVDVQPRRTGEHRDRRARRSGDGHRTEARVVRRRSMGEGQAQDGRQLFEAVRRRIEQHDDEAPGPSVLLCAQVRKGKWPAPPVNRLDDTVPDGLAGGPPLAGPGDRVLVSHTLGARCCARSRQEQHQKQTKEAARPTAITMKAARFRRGSAGAKGVGRTVRTGCGRPKTGLQSAIRTSALSEIRASRRPTSGGSAETGSLCVIA